MEALTSSPKQLKLFHIENPFSLRMGPDFFRSLPSGPGVYFFYGKDGALLYIGQSSDLKARIGSYRHVSPEKNPKRTLRLVHRVVRIELMLLRFQLLPELSRFLVTIKRRLKMLNESRS